MRRALPVELRSHAPAGPAPRPADDARLVRGERALAPQPVGLDRAVADARAHRLLRVLLERERLAPETRVQFRPRPQRLVADLRRDRADGREMVLQFRLLIGEELELIVVA